MSLKFFVTGGAGFIGSTFCDTALARGCQVVNFDDFSTGQEFFIQGALKNPHYKVVRGDIRSFEVLQQAIGDFKPNWVVHFAANADVRKGFQNPRKDLDYNTIGTYNVAEASRLSGVKNILFSSTGCVYGEPEVFPTPENVSFPEQTSLYGSSKVAGEGILSAYSKGYDLNAIVFRFVSILGARYTHGHVFDFVKKLKADPTQIEVLGDGNQTKSYLHIKDLMKGLWCAIDATEQKGIKGYQVFNIGHDDFMKVTENVKIIAKRMGLNPKLNFTGGVRGWIGDSPTVRLDTSKLKKLGWSVNHSIEQGVIDTVDALIENSHLLGLRQ